MQVEKGARTVTWPVDYEAYSGVSNEQVMGKHPIASSLNHSARVLLAGTSASRPHNTMINEVRCGCVETEVQILCLEVRRGFSHLNIGDNSVRLVVGVPTFDELATDSEQGNVIVVTSLPLLLSGHYCLVVRIAITTLLPFLCAAAIRCRNRWRRVRRIRSGQVRYRPAW